MSLLKLPNELLLEIAQDLTIEEFRALVRTCRRFSHLFTHRLYAVGKTFNGSLQERSYTKWSVSGFCDTIPPVGAGPSSLHTLPLHWAAVVGNLPAIRALVQHGADIHQLCIFDLPHRYPGGYKTPVTLYTRHNCITPLSFAILEEQDDAARLLLELGASPGKFTNDERGWDRRTWSQGIAQTHTPLGIAIQKENEAMVRLLLDHGADPNHQDPTGRRPLFMAVTKGNEAIVNLLLDRGAEPNYIEPQSLQRLNERDLKPEPEEIGSPPLVEAVVYSHTALIRPLVSAGANLGGLLPVLLLVPATCMHETLKKFSQDSPLSILVELGIDVNLRTRFDKQRSVLHYVANCPFFGKANPEPVKALLDLGADETLADEDGRTAYDVWADRGYKLEQEGVNSLREMIDIWDGAK